MLHNSTRNLLLATCIIAAPSLAIAQTTQRDAAPKAAPTHQQNAQSGAQMKRQFLAAPMAGQIRAEVLREADIYTADNQKVGDIDDILLDSRGNIVAVVVGVGGFLGIGEKNVAIPFESLDMRDPSMATAGATGYSTTAPMNRDRMATGAVPHNNPAVTDMDRQRSTAQRAEGMTQRQADRQTGTTAPVTTTAPARRTVDATSAWKPERIILQGITKAELEAAPEFKWDSTVQPSGTVTPNTRAR